ncbi:MAG: DUF2807 domain-containing protein [Caldisericia bacterium]|nr:DUF2807 domain-containing protein [Caldisericia bacterium]
MTIQDYIFEEFDSIQFSCVGTLNIKNGDSFKCTMQIDDELAGKIRLSVCKKVLYLELKQPLNILYWLGRSSTRSSIFTVEVPTLKRVTLSGVGVVQSENMQCEDFSLIINGSGKADLNLHSKNVSVDISGAGTVLMSGQSDKQTIVINGAGNYQAENLETKTTSISIHGAGKTTVFATELLNVSIGGAGSVKYKGSPVMNPSIYGAGSIKRIDSEE